MSTTAAYASKPRSSAVTISTANTNRDGTGALGLLFSAGSSGSRIDDISVVAKGATTAGAVRIFKYNGSAYFLWKEILVTATTPSTSVAVWSTRLQNIGLALQSGWSLYVSTNNAESFDVSIDRAGDI